MSSTINIYNICYCQLCGEACSSVRSLSLHIHNCHKDISKEQYYIKFINSKSSICVCGTAKKFRGLGEGYREYCSIKCRSKNIEPTKYWLGKKQSNEHINSRVTNTNQYQKEQVRKNTCVKKYGIDNPAKLLEVRCKISKSNFGKKCIRTPEHAKAIIASKIKNETLNHKTETKEKIKKSLLLLYQSEAAPCTISEPKYKNHKSGHLNGIYYRSSYELRFLQYCLTKHIECISAECKQYRVSYILNSRRHWYYPDFYLKQYDCIIEIKPKNMLFNDIVVAKISAAKIQHKNFCILTEDELSNLDQFFEKLRTKPTSREPHAWST